MEFVGIQRNISRDVKRTLALILAGGRGTRLKGLTTWRVKPAVPFGGQFRIIDFPLSNCINSGIRKIGVLTQYKSQSLIRHIVRGWNLLHSELGEFIEILPAQQRITDRWYRGTADAVYQNIDIIRRYQPEYVLLLAGDHIYKMDYGPMIGYHRRLGADLTVGCIKVPVSESERFGIMSVDSDRRIVRFREKPELYPSGSNGKEHVMASMGIYVFNAAFLYEQLIKDADDHQSDHDFGKDLIPSLIDTHSVYAYPFVGVNEQEKAYWRDVGTIDSYWQANMELVGVSPVLNLYDQDWPVHTALRQYPPAKFVFNDDGRRGMAVDSMVSVGCVISGAHVENSLLFTNVRVEDYSTVEDSVLLPNVTIGPRCRIRKAIIDKECYIPEGTIIGIDACEDREHYYVSPDGVTLVTPEMLGQMIHRVR